MVARQSKGMRQAARTNRSEWKFLGSALAVSLSLMTSVAAAEPKEAFEQAPEHLRFQAEARARAADKEGPEGAVAAREAAELYFSIWRLYGDAAKKGRPPYKRMDEVLYNAGVMYRRAGMVPEAIKAFRLLAESDKGARRSPLAARAAHWIAGISMSIGEYAEAAAWFERFARESPGEKDAPDSLRDAVVLRLSLGQAAEADADASLFSKHYGSKKAADTAKIVFAIGAFHADRGDFKAAVPRLKASLPMTGKSGM